MGEIIYSANPLQVFGVQIAITVFVMGLGIVGVPMAFLQKHSLLGRGVILVCSLIALLAGLALLASMGYAYTSGTKTLTAKLTGKNIVYNNSSDSNFAPVPVYRLNLGLATAFDIPDEAAYKKMNLNDCFEVMYYPSFSLGLFANSTQTGEQYPGSVGEIRRAIGCK